MQPDSSEGEEPPAFVEPLNDDDWRRQHEVAKQAGIPGFNPDGAPLTFGELPVPALEVYDVSTDTLHGFRAGSSMLETGIGIKPTRASASASPSAPPLIPAAPPYHGKELSIADAYDLAGGGACSAMASAAAAAAPAVVPAAQGDRHLEEADEVVAVLSDGDEDANQVNVFAVSPAMDGFPRIEVALLPERHDH